VPTRQRASVALAVMRSRFQKSLLARRGRTEAVYKIYAESFKDERHLQAILTDAQQIVSGA
jgi:phosphoglucomutase